MVDNNFESHFPSLSEFFIKALSLTINEDKCKKNNSLINLKIENKTFPDRVLANFLILSNKFYSRNEIIDWWEKEFFKNNLKNRTQ